MRFYSFTNYMLSSIQQGIQAGHAAVELFVKYNLCEATVGDVQWKKHDMLYEWAFNHKTFICLNGGDFKGVSDIAQFFEDAQNPYPFAAFYEDQDSLFGLITSVGIVIPEKLYALAEQERRDPGTIKFTKVLDQTVVWYEDIEGSSQKTNISHWEYELIVLINSCGMAR